MRHAGCSRSRVLGWGIAASAAIVLGGTSGVAAENQPGVGPDLAERGQTTSTLPKQAVEDIASLLGNTGSGSGGGSVAAGPCELNPPCAGTPEGEACIVDEGVDTTNGGCNVSPEVFGAVACGETICGTCSTFCSSARGMKFSSPEPVKRRLRNCRIVWSTW